MLYFGWPNQPSSGTMWAFIREKISRGLHETLTPRLNGTKSSFTAYSIHSLLKPRLCLCWPRKCSYKCTRALSPRFAQAVDCFCACTCFVIIAQTSFLLPSALEKWRARTTNHVLPKKKIQRKSELGVPRKKTASHYL